MQYPGLKSKHNEASAIVEQLSLQEKANLCSGHNFWHTEAVERLNVPGVMLTDGPHGLRKQNRAADHAGLNKSVPATCFPTACALAATWDTNLIEEVGIALGQECIAENVAVLLGPGLNIKRHPFCGRNFEYFSEDPLLSGKLASAFVRGVQSQGVGTSVKHFAVNNQEHGRMFMDAIVDMRTLREIYLRGFEIVVKEAQPWTVMCAYNRVNGSYCSEHEWLLNSVLRDEWGFEGLVVSDWGAANNRVEGIISGMDLEMPGSGGVNDTVVVNAVLDGKLDEADLDAVIKRNVSLALLGKDVSEASQQFRTGTDRQSSHNLARRVAAEAIVLLKNDQNCLPLKMGTSIAVIGEFAKYPRYQGTGSSQVNPTTLDNAWQGIAEYSDAILYAPGYDHEDSTVNQVLIDDAVNAANNADVAIVFAGLPSIYESEGFDRNHLSLPEQHDNLISAVCENNPNTIVVLANGAPVTMPWVDKPKAIIEGYLLGQAGGSALADVVFGTINPSGKLAETFPISAGDVPADRWFPGENRQMQYREGLNVGYRYFDSAKQPVLFPFGHGLSYTRFEYSDLSVEVTHTRNDQQEPQIKTEVYLDITNTGSCEGAEVVQCYVHDREASVYRPEQELGAFTKVFLGPGETQRVQLKLHNEAFSFYDIGQEKWIVESGEFELRIGSSSRDIRLRSSVQLEGDTHVSEAAKNAMPARDNNFAIADSKEAFSAMLQKETPDPESLRPFQENSSIGELGETWLGRRIRRILVDKFLGAMGGSTKNKTLNKMFEEMANNLPLRALVLFSKGQVTHTHIQLLVCVLNYQFPKALHLWAQHKVTHHQRKLARSTNP